MMTTPASRARALALAGTIITGLVLAPMPAVADGRGSRSIVVAVDPGQVAVTPLPCDERGAVTVSMTNTGSEPVFADAIITADEGLVLSRQIFSSYLPAADPDQPVTAPLQVHAARGTAPGERSVRVSVGRRRLDLPVTVLPAPGTGPGDNLARYRQPFASSTHANVSVCGGVDGDADSGRWGASGTHDQTAGVFPDTYGVELDGPMSIGRIELQTLDSARHPAARMGIRDFDLQARVDGAWLTVASFRDNELGRVSATFAPVVADRVQVVTHDSNDHKYSRIVELEVYAS